MPDMQIAFDVVVSLIGGMGGWILKTIWEAIKDLQKKDEALGVEVHQVHILVAGNYVKREELDKHLTAIFELLRRIEGKFDGKVDKK